MRKVSKRETFEVSISSLITVRFSLVGIHRSGRKQFVTTPIRYRFGGEKLITNTAGASSIQFNVHYWAVINSVESLPKSLRNVYYEKFYDFIHVLTWEVWELKVSTTKSLYNIARNSIANKGCQK